jgi:ankyrin repeat protein
MELGADVNKARDTGATPLFIAAYKGHETVLRALIEAGADISTATDNDGSTPLYAATHNGHEAIVQILRDAGAM